MQTMCSPNTQILLIGFRDLGKFKTKLGKANSSYPRMKVNMQHEIQIMTQFDC